MSIKMTEIGVWKSAQDIMSINAVLQYQLFSAYVGEDAGRARDAHVDL